MRRGLSAACVFAASRRGAVLVREGAVPHFVARRLLSSAADSAAATTGEAKTYAQLELENERLRKTVTELRSELAKMGPVRRFGQFVSNMPRKKFMRVMFLSFLLAQTMLTGAILLYRSLPKQQEEDAGKESPQIS